MKSILIIGLGRFGHHLALQMAKQGNEIMIVDESEEKLTDLLPHVTSSVIGDCTNPDVLESLGVSNFDICFVCIGTNFQSSLEITSQLKEMGAKYVVSKANRDIHAKFLLRNGADEVVYPDRDIAEKAAMKYSANHVFDYIELSKEFAIYEIPTPKAWDQKLIRNVDIRARYHVTVLGVKTDDNTSLMPMADYCLKAEEHLMVVGRKEDVDKLLKMEHV